MKSLRPFKKQTFITLMALALLWSATSVEGQQKAGKQKATEEKARVRIDKVSTSSFEETIKNLENTLKANGMMIVATIDHQNMLSMIGVKIKGSKTIEFGKPDMGKMLFEGDPAAGLEMPARFYVYETPDGKVVVSHYKASVNLASYGKEPLNKVGAMMDMMCEKIATECTQ